ncbi:BrnT family toxin [Longimicrobium sp.]|uniref:BrnT family toxin n=1 Tax=Longimicrobium sp. TaxID=2029185 RepID=UPI0032C21CEA
MSFEFEWDSQKALANRLKHEVDFEEACTVFKDPWSVTISDEGHSQGEERFLILGTSDAGRLLVVAHTERGERIRIISARAATRGERRDYERRS